MTAAHALDPSERTFLRALGKRIRLRRVDCELSQEELARRARMSRNFVSSVERGAHGIDIVRVLRLAAALGVGLQELVPPIEQAARPGMSPDAASPDRPERGGS
jgi:transcriptional regulator with XRE-family HTH domain